MPGELALLPLSRWLNPLPSLAYLPLGSVLYKFNTLLSTELCSVVNNRINQINDLSQNVLAASS